MSLSPVMAFAAGFSGLETLVIQLQGVLGKVMPLLFALAIIYFFWGIIKFIRSAGDPKAAAEGKSIMIYGVIAIAVMVSVYGLVNWITTTLSLDNSTVNLPDLPTS